MPAKKIYPWESWLCRKKLRLQQGKHFECQPYAMAQQIRNAANSRGISFSVRVLGTYVIAEKV